MSQPSVEQVRRIARLARLRLEPDEIRRLQADLGRILQAFSALESVDVDGVEPTSHVLDLAGGDRDDRLRPGLDRDRVLGAAPDAADGHFRTPRVLG